MQTLMAGYIVGALVLIAVSVPLLMRKVRPNYFYGFRTRQTLGSEQVWYDVNAYSARWLIGAGVLTLVTALLVALIPGIGIDGYAIICSVIMLSALTAAVIMSLRYARTLTG